MIYAIEARRRSIEAAKEKHQELFTKVFEVVDECIENGEFYAGIIIAGLYKRDTSIDRVFDQLGFSYSYKVNDNHELLQINLNW